MSLIRRLGGRRAREQRAGWNLTSAGIAESRRIGGPTDSPLRADVEWWDVDDFEEVQDEVDEAGVQMYAERFRAGTPVSPVIAEDTGRLFDGYHRLNAARRVGLTSIPVLVEDYEG